MMLARNVVRSVLRSTIRDVVRGGGSGGPTNVFSPLKNSLLNTLNGHSNTGLVAPVFGDAANDRYTPDCFGKWNGMLPEEQPQEGQRRVENILAVSTGIRLQAVTGTATITQIGPNEWTAEATAAGTTIRLGTTVGGTHGGSVIGSIDLKASVVIGGTVTMDVCDKGSTNITSQITGTYKRFSTSGTGATSAYRFIDVYIGNTGSIFSFRNPMVEDATGRPDIVTPSEYVPIQNGTGPEILTDPNFDNGISEWSAHNSATLAWDANRLSVDSNGALIGNAFHQFTAVIGKTYVFSAEITTGAQAAVIAAGTTPGSGGDVVFTNTGGGEVSKRYTIVFQATATVFYLRLGRTTSAAANPVYFDNLIFKEIDHGANVDGVKNFPTVNRNVVKNNLVTVAPLPGEEIVTNGTFDTSTTGWTAGNNALLSVADGELVVTYNGTNNPYAYQIVPTIPGRMYKLVGSFTATEGSAASINVGTTAAGSQLVSETPSATLRTVERYFVASGNVAYISLIYWTSTNSGQFDDIGLVEVTTELNIVKTRPNHLVTDNVNGNFASTPDTLVNSPTADVTVIWYGTLADWTPADAEALVAKYDPVGNNRCWDLYVVAGGVLRFITSTDGTATLSYDCPTNPSTVFPDGTGGWLKCEFYTNVNSTSYAVLSYSHDPYTSVKDPVINWSPLATTATKANTSIYDGNAVVSIGQHATGDNSNGTHYRGIVYSGIPVNSEDVAKEIIVNGDFGTGDLSDWINPLPARGSAAYDNGTALLTNNGAGGGFVRIVQGFAAEIGASYLISADITDGDASDFGIGLSNNADGTAGYGTVTTPTTGGKLLSIVKARAATVYMVCYLSDATDAVTGNFDNISVKRIDPSIKIADWNPGQDSEFRVPKSVTSKYGYGTLTGTAGDGFTTPAIPAYQITGSLEMAAYASKPDWTDTSHAFMGMSAAAGNRGFAWYVDSAAKLVLISTTNGDGINEVFTTSTQALPFPDGTPGWAKVKADVPNTTVTFYFSNDPLSTKLEDVNWIQLGEPVVVASLTAFAVSTDALTVGSHNARVSRMFKGQIHRAVLMTGLNGQIVADYFPLRDYISGSTMTSRSPTEEVWTQNGTAKYSYTWTIFGDAYLTNNETIYYLEPTGYLGESEVQELGGKSADFANWTAGSTATVAQDAVGMTGTPNTGFTITDNDNAATQTIKHNPGISGTQTYFATIVIPYDSAPSVYPRIGYYMEGGTTVALAICFNPSDGSFVYTQGSAGVFTFRVGLNWHIVMQTATNGTNTNAGMYFQPAYNTNGSVTQDVTAQGSTKLLLFTQTQGKWSYSPIFTTGGITDTRPATIEPTIDFDWDKVDAEGSLTIKASPKFTGTPLANWGILTVTAAADNITYFSQTSGTRLGSYDGTTGVAIQGAWGYVGENIEIRITWGDGFFQYSAIKENGAILLSANTAYDGSWNPAADVITLLKSLGLACSVSYLEAWPIKRDEPWLTKRAA